MNGLCSYKCGVFVQFVTNVPLTIFACRKDWQHVEIVSMKKGELHIFKTKVVVAYLLPRVRQWIFNFTVFLALKYHYTLYQLIRIEPQLHGLPYLINDMMRRQTDDYHLEGTEPMKSKEVQPALWDTR